MEGQNNLISRFEQIKGVTPEVQTAVEFLKPLAVGEARKGRSGKQIAQVLENLQSSEG